MEQQYRKKIDACLNLTKSMSDWEKSFLNDTSTFSTLSLNQKTKIDQIYSEYIERKNKVDSKNISYESDRVKIKKTTEGHQIYIDGREFGEPLTKRESDFHARFICRAIEMYDSDINTLNKKPKRKRKNPAFTD